MMIRTTLLAFILLTSTQADADAEQATPQISKSSWTIHSATCPVGCPTDVQQFLKPLVGQSVSISANDYHTPFTDACTGTVHVEFMQQKIQSKLSELNGALKPGKKITAKMLGLTGDQVTSAVVYCKTEQLDSPLSRIISIEPDRILVLFEQGSIIELN